MSAYVFLFSDKQPSLAFSHLVFCRKRPESKNSVFRLKVNGHTGRNEVGGHHGHADAEVGEHAVLELERGATDDLLPHLGGGGVGLVGRRPAARRQS